jgi:oligopeptide transport system ATP-binding protein
MTALLDVQELSVEYARHGHSVAVVNRIAFSLKENEVLGVVGESGSGKTQLMLAMLGLQPDTARVSGKVLFDKNDVLSMSNRELETLRCNDIAIIFQDPMSALNPYLRIDTQLTESLIKRQGVSRTQAYDAAVQMLDRVRIPNPQLCMRQYPYQLSGGMRQRVMIAMALLREPRVVIADEPTTALDVTVQSEILALLKSLQEEFSLSIILITHDMSIVAGQCDRVMVMYAGQQVEMATTERLFYSARHPYTQGLLLAARSQSGLTDSLYSIPGQPPTQISQLSGCIFSERCDQKLAICDTTVPEMCGDTNQQQACHLYTEWA